jgi:hypothetical protein
MTATTPAAFDMKPRQIGVTIDCIAGAAILAGQAVVMQATGDSYSVIPCDSDTSAVESFVGVALHSQATTGGHVAVLSHGSVCLVYESAGSTIDAGDFVIAGAAAGCVVPVGTTAAAILGYALTDASANGTCYVMISPSMTLKSG